MTKGLRQQALRELVQDRLLVQEAARIGLTVSDDELRSAIMRTPQFATGGVFDKAAYERYLDYINVKPGAFEETQREYLLKRKIERVIEDGVDATEDEVRAAYASRNPKAKAGAFEKDRETFRQSYLSEKKRDAVTAAVQELYKKAKIKTNIAEL